MHSGTIGLNYIILPNAYLLAEEASPKPIALVPYLFQDVFADPKARQYCGSFPSTHEAVAIGITRLEPLMYHVHTVRGSPQTQQYYLI